MTARDATILALIAFLSTTRFFDRLTAKLDNPALKERAIKIRENGGFRADV